MLLNDHVGIDTAEAKSIHARPPGFRPAVDPGPGFGVQVERCLLQLELRIRLFAVDGGRQYFVMQGEASLDESGDPGTEYTQPNLTIDKVELVYFVSNPYYQINDPNYDLRSKYIQPVWHFQGVYANGTAFDVLIQALKQDFLLPELVPSAGIG